MNLLQWLAWKSGWDIRSARYSYGEDPVLGFISRRKHADRWVNSTCGYCSVGCGMQLGVRGGKVVSVRGDPNHPVSLGKLCPKGLAEHYAIDAEDRAKYPLLRKNGQLTRVGWGEAIDVLVERFREVQRKYGPDSLGIVSTGQLVTEEFYTLGKLVQLGFGTNNYDGNTTLCMSTAVAGYKRSFGSDGPPGAYEDIEAADVILLIGANVAENHPILCTRLETNRKKTLIVADPRVTKTAMMADVYLPVKPRSDLALINAILRIVIDEELYDKQYVAEHTAGFEELRASLELYTLEHAASITGLAPDLIRKTALLYGKAQAAFIGWTMGVNHSTKGTETVNAINNLALVTGNIGRLGASPFSITGQCNAMGTREAGFASGLPGYRKFECGGSGGAGAAVEHACRSHSHQARPRLSRHHRSYCIEKDSGTLDYRHQSISLLSKYRRAQTWPEQSGLSRGAGWLSSNADDRVGRYDVASSDLGRERRVLTPTPNGA